MFTGLNINRMSGRLIGLGFEHLSPMLHTAWNHAFEEERNLLGWRKEGIIPFTRNEYWVLKHQVESQELLSSKASGVYARSSSQSEQRSSPESPAGAQCESEIEGLTIPEEVLKKAEEAVQASNTQPDPAIAEILRYLGSFIVRNSGSQVTREILGMQRVADAMHRMEHPDPMAAELRNVRITAKDFWNLPGSATGEEALAIAKNKAEERQLKEAAVEERRIDRESKKRRDLTTAVLRSEVLLLEISSQGPSRLSSLVLKDLKALLLHDRPDGSAEVKGTKPEIQARVARIPDVVRALEAYASTQLNVAQPRALIDPPRVYPPVPQPPPPPTPQAPHVPLDM